MSLAICSNTDSSDPESGTDTGDNATIESIVADYNAAMADTAESETIEYSCPDHPVSGVVRIHHAGPEVRLIEYSEGYEHGGRNEQYLVSGNRLRFAYHVTSTWSFDPESPDSENPGTVDTEIQERYYFNDEGELIRALKKEASARSVENQNISGVMRAIPNGPHPQPNAAAVTSRARALLQALDAGRIRTSWCGLSGS
ncbi:MAG: hypothetical protein KDK27_21165 [Leptospiraceae bacterium]|nr:hypothetical protein [Leptospiraceae bacterium]